VTLEKNVQFIKQNIIIIIVLGCEKNTRKQHVMSDVFLLGSPIKLMKGIALRKHSLHEKTAASVLLNLFISSNE